MLHLNVIIHRLNLLNVDYSNRQSRSQPGMNRRLGGFDGKYPREMRCDGAVPAHLSRDLLNHRGEEAAKAAQEPKVG
jgi:hypothetical protein